MSHEAAPPGLTEADPPADPQDDNVVSLYGWPIPRPNEPIESVVRRLRYMLDRAEKGELLNIAIVGVGPSRTVTWAYDEGAYKLHELIGAVAVMQARLVGNLLNVAEQVDLTDQIPPAS